MKSALYIGDVMHKRLQPHVHQFVYRLFYLLLDLDELDSLSRRSRLFKRNRFSVFSFYDRDHGDGGEDFHEWVREKARTVDISASRFQILCLPRILGYTFNPISVIYCYDSDDYLTGVIYEVNNTFGERTWYAFQLDNDVVDRNVHAPRTFVHGCDKQLYVSPFFEVTGQYRFRLIAPGDSCGMTIRYGEQDDVKFVASFAGGRRSFSDRSLAYAFFMLPFVTLKTILAIHFEALRLWMKSVPYVSRKSSVPSNSSSNSGADVARVAATAHVQDTSGQGS